MRKRAIYILHLLVKAYANIGLTGKWIKMSIYTIKCYNW